MKISLTIVLLFLFCINCFCQRIGPADQYTSFKAKYSFRNYYKLNNRLNIHSELESILDIAPLIDTSYLIPMNLIDTIFKGKDGLLSLAQYECHFLALIERNQFDCIISHSYSSNAGDGNPIILVATYDKRGNFLSRIKLNLIYQHDYSPIPRQYFKMFRSNKIQFYTKSRNYIIYGSGNKERLKHENTDHFIELYLIEETGIIKQMN